MTNAEMDELFALYLADNPGGPNRRQDMTLADGRVEPMMDIDTTEAFLRWCLRKGFGDREKVVSFLSDIVPRLRMPNWGGLKAE